MTRKDYTAFAAELIEIKPPKRKRSAYLQWETCVRRVAHVFADDNPRFDRERFYDAAGFNN